MRLLRSARNDHKNRTPNKSTLAEPFTTIFYSKSAPLYQVEDGSVTGSYRAGDLYLRLLIPFVLGPDQRGDTYFLFYAFLKDKQGVYLAACNILHITQ